ncbi:MAG: phosphotransferase [Chloroflexi bacterium]|nr:phosphotransferase [Chloroflexota bacterium]
MVEAIEQLKKVGEGREAEMFEWGDGKILRLQRDPDSQARVALQAVAIEAASKSGLRVPAVYGEATELGRPGLIMERLDGTDILTLLGTKPWKLLWAARVCSELHAQMHDAIAVSEIVPLKQRIRGMIESSDKVPERFAAFVLKELDELPDGDRLLHGDFHPGNVMTHGDEPVVIDWTAVSRGDPAADFARTRLLLRIGELPPGAPFLLHVIAAVGRSVLWRLYDREYRRRRSPDMSIVERWETVRVADRLVEGIAEERPTLLKVAKAKLAAV